MRVPRQKASQRIHSAFSLTNSENLYPFWMVSTTVRTVSQIDEGWSL
jgi:hypothetical protein